MSRLSRQFNAEEKKGSFFQPKFAREVHEFRSQLFSELTEVWRRGQASSHETELSKQPCQNSPCEKLHGEALDPREELTPGDDSLIKRKRKGRGEEKKGKVSGCMGKSQD